MHLRLYTFFIIFICFNNILYSQDAVLTTKSKKAIQYYNSALKEFNSYNHAKALDELSLAIKKDSSFIEAYLLSAQINNSLGNTKNEIANYLRAITINQDFYHNGYYHLALAQLKNGEYENAKQTFIRFSNFEDANRKFLENTAIHLKKCDFGIQAIQNPVDFKPISLGDSINTMYDEYWPSLSADESILVFTRLLPRNPAVETKNISLKTHHEDLYISYKVNNEWGKSANMGKMVNSGGNEGTQTLSVDGNHYFFTACNRPDSHGGCDIYFVEKEGNTWTKPLNLGQSINSKFLESQPSISSDGQTLYFVSNRPGGYGKFDIWKSILSDDGYWQKPVNLGDTINTSEDEQSPFIHADNETLYFASNGHMGLGNSDIFISKKTNNEWSKPKNIGYPINTHNDEYGLFIAPNGKIAYFATNRNEETGRDIFYFQLPESIQPNIVIYVKGKVKDAISKKYLLAKIELIDLDNSDLVSYTISDESNGSYLICLPAGRNYALNVSKRGYLFHSENFSLKNYSDELKPFELNVDLQPIAIGSKGILNNIFFQIDSYDLMSESYIELEKLLDFLKNNPNIKIEISGHTDNTGGNEYNLDLSEKRAKSVFDYLTLKNINSNRLTFKGYGADQPIADNASSEGRAKNRRTEFMITWK